jgi:CDP-diacylglycerol--glycerol-3-phosphate 3-phosphatidyltransferase
MVPVLLYFALNGKPYWFLAVLIFSVFTDVLDGFVARQLNLVSDTGAHLDSIGDFSIYSTITLGAYLLWPQTVLDEIVYVSIIVLSFALPTLVGLIKFHALTGYHTISVKVAVAFTLFSYVLLFADISPWPFRIASLLCCYAAMEEVAISLILKHERVDVLSLWHALQYKKKN